MGTSAAAKAAATARGTADADARERGPSAARLPEPTRLWRLHQWCANDQKILNSAQRRGRPGAVAVHAHGAWKELTMTDRPAWVNQELFPFESHFMDVDGARVHYVDEGQGPVFLAMHGNPTWSFLYRHIINGLKDRFRCIALDSPGFGLSTAPEGYGYTTAEHSKGGGELRRHAGPGRHHDDGPGLGRTDRPVGGSPPPRAVPGPGHRQHVRMVAQGGEDLRAVLQAPVASPYPRAAQGNHGSSAAALRGRAGPGPPGPPPSPDRVGRPRPGIQGAAAAPLGTDLPQPPDGGPARRLSLHPGGRPRGDHRRDHRLVARPTSQPAERVTFRPPP